MKSLSTLISCLLLLSAVPVHAELIGELKNAGTSLGYIILDLEVLESLPVLSNAGILPEAGQLEYVDDATLDTGIHQLLTSLVADPTAPMPADGAPPGQSSISSERYEIIGTIHGQGKLVRSLGREPGEQSGRIYFLPRSGGE